MEMKSLIKLELVVFPGAGNVPFLACAASDSALSCIERVGVSSNMHELVPPARCIIKFGPRLCFTALKPRNGAGVGEWS